MPDLEQRIARWRAELERSLPHLPEAAQEMEEHLRDNIAALVESGTPPETAFELSVARLGRTEDLAGQFAKMDSRWLTASRVIRTVHWGWLTAAVLNELALLIYAAGNPTWIGEYLLIGHVTFLITGYVSVIALGVFGIGAQVVGWNRPLTTRESRDFRRALSRCTVVSAVLTALGFASGLVWGQRHLGQAWTNSPGEWGVALVLLCLGVILRLQSKPDANEKILCAMATLGGVAGFVGWFGAGTGLIPMGAAIITLAVAITQLLLLLMRPAPQDPSQPA